MTDDDILRDSLMEDSWLTLEQVGAACRVEPAWLLRHIEEDLFPQGRKRGRHQALVRCLLRARRMRQLERDFDAVPELAALVAGLLEERNALRAQILRSGTG